MKPGGIHLLADFYGCSPALLDDGARLTDLAMSAVVRSGATILGHHTHQFDPQGVTIVIAIAESHLALHTWPENGYVALDYFTCGDRVVPGKAIDLLREALAPARVELREIVRGQES